ncbi:hypothetical protein [Streptosporangium sp. NBC_01756]|uniref:hypothetical protein n=1 Tax=Streptosporangium sp. NBC_01756 TaxID=2975950 RepID=UPI002DD8CB14|nr:hypothetical protein [Streptosporangium sp. NBC_01756]WSC83320.1 hypothetical protein OIE48_23210 [Streptosporangium sp. NBC_01756]
MSSLSPPRSRHLGWTLALLAFAQLITSLDFNIVFVALPRIGEGLGWLTGEALHGEVADGLRIAVFAAAAGILLSALIALTFKRRQAETETEKVHADA